MLPSIAAAAREPAGEVGDAVAVQQIALAVVLRVHQQVGARDAGRGNHRPACTLYLGAAIGVRHGGEIGLAELLARSRQCAVERGVGRPARRSCRAHRRRRGRDRHRCGGPRRADCPNRPARRGRPRGAPRDRTGRSALSKMSRNRPEMRRRHVDARPVEVRQRHDLDAGDAAGRLVPHRLHAEVGTAPGRDRRRRCAARPRPRDRSPERAAARRDPAGSAAPPRRRRARRSRRQCASGWRAGRSR